MNRGDHREDIFKDDKHRHRFLSTLGEACVKTDWQIHALCLMRNHFHLVIETPRARQMEGRRAQEQGADYRAIRRGSCLGREEFGKELLGAAAEQAGPNHYGADRQESGEEKAQRMVRAAMKELGWDEKELRSRPKGDKAKVKLARRLRKETTMRAAGGPWY